MAADKDEGKSVESDLSYGNCEGPNSMYIKLVSSDGHEFIIKRQYALISDTIAAMLTGPGQFAENEINVIHFKNIRSHILEKVCLYFTYRASYADSSSLPNFPISPDIALELLMAANFLNC